MSQRSLCNYHKMRNSRVCIHAHAVSALRNFISGSLKIPRGQQVAHPTLAVRLFTDLSFAGTVRDFKEADTFSDLAIAAIFAAPGLKQAEALRYAGEFRKAYQAAKDAGDIKAAHELLELAQQAQKSPNKLSTLAVKESSIKYSLNALEGMRNNGGHAIRHLEGIIIPNQGSLESRVNVFRKIALPILQSPIYKVEWRIGATNGIAHVGQSNGKYVAIVVAKDGPYKDKVLASFIPDANQLQLIKDKSK